MRRFLIAIAALALGVSFAATSYGRSHIDQSFRNLSESDIKKHFVGKTVEVKFRGKTHFLYVKADGSLEHGIEGRGKVFKRKWWVNDDEKFCRTLGRGGGKKVCVTVRSLKQSDTRHFLFLLKNGRKKKVTVHEGRKMP